MMAIMLPRAVVSPPCQNQPNDHHHDFVIRHLIAHIVSADQVGDEVVLGSFTSLLGQLSDPGRHLHKSIFRERGRPLWSKRKRIRDNGFGESPETRFVPISRRNAGRSACITVT